MTVENLLVALNLPVSCRVDQRVPKKMLIENGAPTAADKRLLNDAIEEIQWLAALKPNTVGVPDYRDEEREYLEVAVLSITAKPVHTTRLAELVHRAVPYPLLLLLATPQGLFLSMAHKRWAQNEAGKVVLDGEIATVATAGDLSPMHPFMQSLALARQPQATLRTLYQGWLDCRRRSRPPATPARSRPWTTRHRLPCAGPRCVNASGWSRRPPACARRRPRKIRWPSRWT